MKQILTVFASLTLLCGCTGSSNRNSDADGDTVRIDTVYSSVRTVQLLNKAMQHGPEMTQTDYAEMIEQTRAINRRMIGRLSAINFNAEMTDEEINEAMAALRADTVMAALESQSRKLLFVLQNADLDASNRDRYASMTADAEAGLRSLR